MTANFICYKKCSTCKKAEKFLRDNNVAYTARDYTEEPLNVQEITDLWKLSGLPLSKFFNTSGQIYRNEKIKDKLPGLTEEAQIILLSKNPKLIKRPIIQAGASVLVGFKEDEWKGIVG